jgi:hypothetical protein
MNASAVGSIGLIFSVLSFSLSTPARGDGVPPLLRDSL